MNLGWGKPKIWIKELASNGAWTLIGTPVEDSTNLESTKGDKKEAPIEGGGNEDVIYNRNTVSAVVRIRAAKGRACPVPNDDGVVANHYAIACQPEDPTTQGFAMQEATVSVADAYSPSEGASWEITFDAVKQGTFKQSYIGVVTVTGATGTAEGSTATSIKIKEEDDNAQEIEIAPAAS